MPDVLGIARAAMKEKIKKWYGLDINPDELHLAYYGPNAHNQLRYIWAITLTGALLINYHALEKGESPSKLNSHYRIIYNNNSQYGSIHPAAVWDMIQEINIVTEVHRALKKFWSIHKENWRSLIKAEFIRAARRAKEEGVISELDLINLFKGLAPEVSLSKPLTLEHLETCKSYLGIQVDFLGINGYFSNNILRVLLKNGKVILYIPSIDQQAFYQYAEDDFLFEKSKQFYAFNNDRDMRAWIINQAKDKQLRFLLSRHFSLYNRKDGITYTGVDNGLKKLAEGLWDPAGRGIGYDYSTYTKDVFEAIALLTMERSFEDTGMVTASYDQIKSNSLFYFNAINFAAGPLLILCEPLRATLKLRNFTEQLGFKLSSGRKDFKDVESELLIEMEALFGATKSVIPIKKNLQTKTCDPLEKPHIHNKEIKKDFYKELKAKFPDLQVQLDDPDPFLVEHDKRALNESNCYLGKENCIIDLFVKSTNIYLESETHLNLSLVNFKKDYESFYKNFKNSLAQAYTKSTTFRRLFNLAYEQELQYPHKRWLIMPFKNLQLLATRKQFSAKEVRMIGLYENEVIGKEKEFFQSGSCLVPFSIERYNLHEIVKALTNLSDFVSHSHPRGPVVEYTNIILKEMNLAVPVRTQLISNLSDSKKAVLQGLNCLNYAIYLQLRNTVISTLPNFKEMASQVMRSILKEQTGLDLDPDKVYLNYFGKSPKHYSSQAFLKWTRDVQPEWSITLTALPFCNYNSIDEFKSAARLNEEYGVYWQGFGCDHYGIRNEIKIKPSVLRDIIWKLGFATKVDQELSKFWNEHQDDWRMLAKAEFLRSALEAKEKGFLDENDYVYLLMGLTPGVPINKPVTLFHLRQKSIPLIDVRLFDINGYTATDILRFLLKDGKEILYIPGSQQSFYTFESDHRLRQWIVEQATNLKKRFKIATHFSLYNRQDGNTYTGVDNALQKLAEGDWQVDGSGIDYYEDYKIKEDVFDVLAKKTKRCKFKDANTLIMSNSELCEQRVLMAFQIVGMFFSIPLMFFGPIGATFGTALFATTLGIESHIAIFGDSAEERKQAAKGAETDVGTAALFGAASIFIVKSMRLIKEVGRELLEGPKQLATEFEMNVLDTLQTTSETVLVEDSLIEPAAPPETWPTPLSTPVLENGLHMNPSTRAAELTGKLAVASSISNKVKEVTRKAIPDKVVHFYKELYWQHPDLQLQLENPDPLLLQHDSLAIDTSNRFLGESNGVIESFIKNKKEMAYFEFKKVKTKNWRDFPVEYYVLRRIITDAYTESPTFRRLYNYAYDTELFKKENRWVIAPNEAIQTTISGEGATHGRTIGLNIDLVNRRYYQSGDTFSTFNVEHAYLHEVIEALTRIPYEPSSKYPRGPVVEYTNIVLKEIAHQLPSYGISPVRTKIIASLSIDQKGALEHYSTLAQKYPNLRLQSEHPDPYLLDHDRVAVDSKDYLTINKMRVIDLMFTKNSLNLARKTREYEFLAILLNKAYVKSPTFRRLFNYARFSYKWDKPDNRVELVVKSKNIRAYYSGSFVDEKGYIHVNPKSKTVLYLNHNIKALSNLRYMGCNNKLCDPSFVRVYIHEVVHALTNLEDVTIGQHIRGPVVEYTNVILLEMGLPEPVRALYSLPELDSSQSSISTSSSEPSELDLLLTTSPRKASLLSKIRLTTMHTTQKTTEGRWLCKSPLGVNAYKLIRNVTTSHIK
ncbi:hypothetical protein Zmor_008828 [Zophobas morio]|uniref:Dermonecrotic toxin N-terminal domain-containing protein n=1 Tax=Zophobas morio TaxID=2755281 RepID=A0AA38HJ85_9CUCU|nr:hypothetical protein Zmor_008828 [Zophobas morio]